MLVLPSPGRLPSTRSNVAPAPSPRILTRVSVAPEPGVILDEIDDPWLKLRLCTMSPMLGVPSAAISSRVNWVRGDADRKPSVRLMKEPVTIISSTSSSSCASTAPEIGSSDSVIAVHSSFF